MKILQINTVYPYGSTGKIAKGIHDICIGCGIECTTAYRYAEKGETPDGAHTVSSYMDCHVHNRISTHTMLQGVFSYFKTRSFLKWVDNYNPDVIHLHNIHGSYINHRLLFKYIKSKKVKTVWTLHDCWAMTGACPYFDMIGCDRWKNECRECPQKKKQQLDFSKTIHRLKKEWFSDIDNMTIVTPSVWLADLVKQSFLKDYPVKVINNGIDLSVFKPTDSDFRTRYGIPQSKNVILGVAFGWGKRKGLDVFVDLAKRLDGENYQIVLVGTDPAVDKQLPDNIISIHRTQNQTELAEIYTAADLFVNPTREEVLGLVNIEALACGTPVLTFRTGGCPEIVDETCGCVVDCDDVDAMEREITRICTERAYSKDDCILRARAFDKDERFKEYVELYESLVHI